VHKAFGRLGNLFQQKAAFLKAEAINLEPKIAAACQSRQQEEAGRLRNTQARLRSDAEKAFHMALNFYKRDLEFPNNAEIEETLAALGSTLYSMNRSEEAIDCYKRLIRDFPRSEQIPIYYLTIGELRFATNDWKGADQSYAMVLSLPPSAATPCALYKQAWTNFRRGYIQLARRAFSSCRKLALDQSGGNPSAAHLATKCESDSLRLNLGD
jgi:tetratricopeptide (TPR) repeat protein